MFPGKFGEFAVIPLVRRAQGACLPTPASCKHICLQLNEENGCVCL